MINYFDLELKGEDIKSLLVKFQILLVKATIGMW